MEAEEESEEKPHEKVGNGKYHIKIIVLSYFSQQITFKIRKQCQLHFLNEI